MLRQFRMTGTNGGLMLLSSETAYSALRIVGLRQEKTLGEWFKPLYDGWFSSKRPTAASESSTTAVDVRLRQKQRRL